MPKNPSPSFRSRKTRPKRRTMQRWMPSTANRRMRKLLSMAISAARAKGKYIGICGQGPSDHPDLADWLMAQGIESVSLNPDTVVDTWLRLARIKAG